MIVISVPDMHCNSCKASVEAALHPIAGPATIDVNLASRQVTVDGPADTTAMIGALLRIGFPAHLVSA